MSEHKPELELNDDQPEAVETELHQEVVPMEPTQSVTLFRTDDPVEVIEKATVVATALKKIVDSRRLAVNIQGREHVRVEGWTTLGAMLGVMPLTEWTRPLPNGNGWEARVVVRTRNGQLISAADAQCSRSEKTWKSREDYAIRSMAQTRAVSKAMRVPLGFVMTLAGYDPTPAEEIEDGSYAPKISDDQLKDMEALIEDVGANRDAFMKFCSKMYGAPTLADIRASDYGKAVAALEKKRKA